MPTSRLTRNGGGARLGPNAAPRLVVAIAQLQLQAYAAETVTGNIVDRDRGRAIFLEQFARPLQRLVFSAEPLRASPVARMRVITQHRYGIAVVKPIGHPFHPLTHSEEKHLRAAMPLAPVPFKMRWDFPKNFECPVATDDRDFRAPI